jgi:cyanophycinase
MKPWPGDSSGEFEIGGAEPFRVEYAATAKTVQPLYLLADSQLLFWQPDGKPFLSSVRARLRRARPSAAYIGASNGDDPTFYGIFEAAMAEAGLDERRMIRAELGAADLEFLDQADLILLAGGSVERGWRTFEANGLKQILVRRYYEGALFVGISAGAVQLGLGGWGNDGPAGGKLVDTFRILPHLVGAHEEAEEWAGLKAAVAKMGEHTRGYGVPAGGGFVYHPDHSIEPLRKPLVEVRLRGAQLSQSLLLPGERSAEPAEGAEPVH